MARKPHRRGHVNVNELGKVDNTTFLVIVGGALLVVILVMVFLGKMPFVSSQKSSQETTPTIQADTEKPVEGTMVTIENFAFSPASLTIKKGTTVTFTNKDSAEHTTTSDTGDFDTGLLAQGKSGTVTFDTAGTFFYHCTSHPNMTGTIVVEE